LFTTRNLQLVITNRESIYNPRNICGHKTISINYL